MDKIHDQFWKVLQAISEQEHEKHKINIDQGTIRKGIRYKFQELETRVTEK